MKTLILFGLCSCLILAFFFRDKFSDASGTFEYEESEEKIPPTLTKEQREFTHRIREEIRFQQRQNPERVRPVSLDDVGPNVLCNQEGPGRQQAELCIAANILHPDTMIAGSVDFHQPDGLDPWVGFYTTTDGGVTWEDALITHGASNSNAGDPTVCIDHTGRMYAAYVGFNGGPTNLYVRTSTDNGQTWSPEVFVATGVDKPYACVDLSPTSPYYGRYYILWTGSGIDGAYSTDGGATFSFPVSVSDNGNGLLVAPATGPDGQVYATWFGTTIRFDKSLNGGVSWGTDVNLGTFNSFGNLPACPNTNFRNYNCPVVGCDISDGPYRGRIYVCWANQDIFIKRSDDNGVTWSPATRVDDDLSGRLQMFEWLTVHPYTGDVGVSWFDWRENPCGFRCYATVSTDGGTTFEPNFPISAVQSNPTGLWFIGDYSGNTFGNNGKFFAVWTDMREDDGDCYSAWFTGATPQLEPPIVTLYTLNNLLRLSWELIEDVPYYKIYSAVNSGGPYDTFEGVTVANFFDDDIAPTRDKKFYVVTSSTEP